jgi:hypothetical protein
MLFGTGKNGRSTLLNALLGENLSENLLLFGTTTYGQHHPHWKVREGRP